MLVSFEFGFDLDVTLTCPSPYPISTFQDSFFQPYLPLQQIDMLKASSWLVGTSNSIFRQQKDCQIDVIVDVSSSSAADSDPSFHS